MKTKRFLVMLLTALCTLGQVKANNQHILMHYNKDISRLEFTQDCISVDGVTYKFIIDANYHIRYNVGMPVKLIIPSAHFEVVDCEEGVSNVVIKDKFVTNRYIMQNTTNPNEVYVHCDNLEIYFDLDENLMASLEMKVNNIASFTFSNNSTLQSIIIPEGINSIGKNAFAWCANLKSINLPSSLTYIEDECFYGTGLTSIDIPEGIIGLKYGAFWNCTELKEVKLPTTLKYIGAMAFYNTPIEEIDFPEGLEWISKCPDEDNEFLYTSDMATNAFTRCVNLKSVYIPASVTFVGYYTFGQCNSLTSIVVDKENKVYDSRNECNAIIETATNTLIGGCSSSVIPEGVKEIADYSFWGHESLKSITFPEGITSIGKAAFAFTGLTDLELPSSLGYIGERAFEACKPEKIVIWNTEPKPIDEKAFSTRGKWDDEIGGYVIDDYIYEQATLIVPKGTKASYLTTAGWKEFRNIEEMDDVITDIKAVGTTSQNQGFFYSLSGQRLAAPRKGVNIVGGRKFVVK